MKTDKKQLKKAELRQQSSLDLIAATAHDMKTPLILMNGLAERLLEGGLSKEQAQQYIERISISSERLLNLADSLTSAHRNERNVALDLKAVNIRSVIQQVIDELELHAKHRHQSLQFKKGKHQIVLSNRQALYRIVFNLVDNAIKYSKPNGIITIRAIRRGTNISIAVKDSGIGVRKDDLDKIFNLFGQAVEPTNALPGSSGLGLYISRQLAESIGGSLSVVPLKSGSIFSITVPTVKQLEMFGDIQ